MVEFITRVLNNVSWEMACTTKENMDFKNTLLRRLNYKLLSLERSV